MQLWIYSAENSAWFPLWSKSKSLRSPIRASYQFQSTEGNTRVFELLVGMFRQIFALIRKLNIHFPTVQLAINDLIFIYIYKTRASITNILVKIVYHTVTGFLRHLSLRHIRDCYQLIFPNQKWKNLEQTWIESQKKLTIIAILKWKSSRFFKLHLRNWKP